MIRNFSPHFFEGVDLQFWTKYPHGSFITFKSMITVHESTYINAQILQENKIFFLMGMWEKSPKAIDKLQERHFCQILTSIIVVIIILLQLILSNSFVIDGQ